MANVDLSALKNLQPSQPLDLSIYPEARKGGGGSGLPKAGTYTVVAPETFPSDAFSETKAGNLSARVDPTIVGPTNDGYTLRFSNISAKVYQTKDGKETSQVGQYLQAFGIEEELTGDPQQAANLIASTAGQTAQVYADWVVEHRATGYKLVGMRNFPSDGNGGFQSWVEHPDDSVKGQDGERLRLKARLEIRRWLPRTQ